VSELKKAQQELARLNAELEQRVDARTAELRAAQEELVRRERFATLGQLTATVSHELRNPLGAIRTSLYVIDRYASQLDERVARAVGRVNRSITRCDNIIDELLDFARIRDLRFEPLELDAWLDAILDEQQLPEGIAVHKEFGIGDSVVPADADRLRRAVINVYENACQAMRAARADDGALTTSEDQLWITTRLSNERAEMVFEDNGPGIAPGSLSQIFEPLFSTKNFGVGLGLPTVRQIMEQHGGGVEACNVEGGGARFTLWLPLGQNRAAGAQRPT
jgi:signal transduction histidine kinase